MGKWPFLKERKKKVYFVQFSHFLHKMAIFQFLAKNYQFFFLVFLQKWPFPIFVPKRPQKDHFFNVYFFAIFPFFAQMSIFQFLAKNYQFFFLSFSSKMAIFQFLAQKDPKKTIFVFKKKCIFLFLAQNGHFPIFGQ